MLLIEIGILFALVGGLIFKLFPPKRINHIYGYRSRFAMKAQSIWDEGQKYCANGFILTGIIMSILGLFEHFLFRGMNVVVTIENTVEATEVLLSILVIYICCEIHLKNMFNEDGSRKNAADKT